ncbi:MAG: Glu/Leu/Phe/Val dehydrogenase family protein [Pseudomonadota bacterium]
MVITSENLELSRQRVRNKNTAHHYNLYLEPVHPHCLSVAARLVINLGSRLAQHQVESGSDVYVSDIHYEHTHRAVEQLGAVAVPADRIHAHEVDVFSPCAMGGAINDQTLPELSASVIAGAANNQLASPAHGVELHHKGVRYVPDYANNAGGIIDICYQHYGSDYSDMREHVESTADTLREIFERSRRENPATSEVANELAEERCLKIGSTRPPAESVMG